MASGQASGGPDKRARQCSSTVTGEPYAMRLLARHPHANCTPNPRHTPSSGVIFIAPDDGRGVDQFIHRGRHGSGLRGAVSQCGSAEESGLRDAEVCAALAEARCLGRDSTAKSSIGWNSAPGPGPRLSCDDCQAAATGTRSKATSPRCTAWWCAGPGKARKSNELAERCACGAVKSL
jgi:hypothetical protein